MPTIRPTSVSSSALRDQLSRVIDGEVRFDSGSRVIYSTDASNYKQIPIGVVIPRHAGDVIRTVELARENNAPLLARGGGTALGGQTCNAALVIDFSKYMNRAEPVDPERRLITVEPGAVPAQINRSLIEHQLFFAPDPTTSDRCTIGGMIGNNSCGAHSAAYGKTADNLAGLELLLYDGTRLSLGETERSGPDGRIGEIQRELAAIRDRYGDLIRTRYPKIPRRVSGYNLDSLLPENGFNLARAIVGSEGTLGVILKATLKLVPRPKSVAMAVLGFPDVFAAADQVYWILEHRPEALEGFDHNLVDLAVSKEIGAIKLLPNGRAFLIVEFGGATPEEARQRGASLIDDATRCASTSAALLSRVDEQQAVWELRSSGLGSSAFIAGRPRTWPGAEDVAVPPVRLGDFLRKFDNLLVRRNLQCASYYGHFGEGCVHSRINFDFLSSAGVANFRATMIELADLVAEFGGSLSGEHGDGLARSELLPKIFGMELIDAFRKFKRVFDPDGRMNPGNIVDPHPIDSHLRLPHTLNARPVATHFDFSAENGLAGAAMKCVGIGKCRKIDGGTMCPSYMATREERHSTRGRARLLFEALAGSELAAGFQDPALKDALDLCLSCKACKSECPSGVDMASYKAEFLASFYRHRRRPIEARFFGAIHENVRMASLAPGLINAAARSRLFGGTAKRILGIHSNRALPSLAPQSFRRWFKKHVPANPAGREIALFADTFTNFFEPEVAIAAVRVLERAGFRVSVPDRDLCCGRPLYDQGLLDQARRRLTEISDAFAPYLRSGAPVVGLEPSCLLTFRDELPALFPHDPNAHELARRAMLLDEFLVSEGSGPVRFGSLTVKALLHGHCHQKSLVGMGKEKVLLEGIFAGGLDVLDSGCCGMAGAFGYATKHFEISQAIGERVLFPAVRQAASDSIIVADGFACRSQIRQFCPDRKPLHLAQVLDAAGNQSK